MTDEEFVAELEEQTQNGDGWTLQQLSEFTRRVADGLDLEALSAPVAMELFSSKPRNVA